MESHNDLEKHVVERTGILSTANRLLEQETTERHRVEEALHERARLATLVADISVALAQGNSFFSYRSFLLEGLVWRVNI